MIGPHPNAADATPLANLTATRRLAWLGFAAVLLVRVLVFPFAKNFYGDPAMRLKALTAWMAHPFFLRSFIGAQQFGPLHLYLLALGQWIHRDLDGGPRLLSLVCGSLTAFPLFALTHRRFGAPAGLLATLSLSVYSLHIQTSTTATSEAVFLLFLLAALAALDRAAAGAPAALLSAALLMACACAIRYDGWLYAPLSSLWLVAPVRAGRLSWLAAGGYAAATLLVPALLCVGNWVDLGDPLYIVHYINQDHLRMAQRTAAGMGRWRYALYCLTFWPANLAWELSPPVALGLVVGAGWSLRQRRYTDLHSDLRADLRPPSPWALRSDLLWLAAAPAAFFTIEGMLLRFHPLARFTIPTGVLLLPYAGAGLALLWARLPTQHRTRVAMAAGTVAVALPAFLAWRTVGRADRFAETLRPISPVSNLPPEVQATADWIRGHAASRKVEIETNWLYEELPIEFYGHGGGALLFTPRDGPAPSNFEPPDLLVLPKQADVLREDRATLDGLVLTRAGERYRLVATLGQIGIYARLALPVGS